MLRSQSGRKNSSNCAHKPSSRTLHDVANYLKLCKLKEVNLLRGGKRAQWLRRWWCAIKFLPTVLRRHCLALVCATNHLILWWCCCCYCCYWWWAHSLNWWGSTFNCLSSFLLQESYTAIWNLYPSRTFVFGTPVFCCFPAPNWFR